MPDVGYAKLNTRFMSVNKESTTHAVLPSQLPNSRFCLLGLSCSGLEFQKLSAQHQTNLGKFRVWESVLWLSMLSEPA